MTHCSARVLQGPTRFVVLDSCAPRCNIENTKRSQLRFRTVLEGGQREVRFERVTPYSPNVG
jgi:hypothetical protein